jgi:hypothetical protein
MAFRNLSPLVSLPSIPEIKLSRLITILAAAHTDPSFTHIASGLLSPTITPHYTPQFHRLLTEYQTVLLCREFFSRSESARWKSELESTSIKFCDIIRRAMADAWDSELSALHCNSTGPTPALSMTDANPIQETSRLALIIFYLTTNQTQQMLEIASGYRAQVVTKFKSTLECTDLASFWGPNGEALVWVLFLGAYMSAGHKERSWYIMGLVRGAQILELKDWNGVREMLLKYLYLDRVFKEGWERIWDEVELLVDVGPSFWHAGPAMRRQGGGVESIGEGGAGDQAGRVVRVVAEEVTEVTTTTTMRVSVEYLV